MAAATHITLASAPQPGAIALLQLQGPAAVDLLVALTGRPDWPPGRMRHVRLGDIDDGCAVCLRGGPHGWVQLLPHGGPRVVQRLTRWLAGHGAKVASRVGARALYPEADSDLEADLLALLARAASPAAIDLLLAQPAQWRRALRHGYDRTAVLQRSGRLDRLIDPPTVAVVGVPNVGKSTLSNRLRGRQASLVSDLPGTTRDWVSGLVVLCGLDGPRAPAVAVRWVDTPGLARSADPLERRAIDLARHVVRTADVVIALREPGGAWPVAGSLSRVPDLWAVNKCEGAAASGDGASMANPLPISAHSGLGLDRLQEAVLARLDLADLGPPQPWAFSAALRRIVDSGDAAKLAVYAGPGDPAA